MNAHEVADISSHLWGLFHAYQVIIAYIV